MLINFKLAHITKFFDVQLFVVCRRLRVAIGSLYARLRFMPEFLKRTISRHFLSLSLSLSENNVTYELLLRLLLV